MAELPPLLLVDDDPDDLFILRRLLAKAGVENKTVGFEDPRVAVGHLEAVIRAGDRLYLPCVIFTDLQMPTMSGLEFARWVRSQPTLARTSIIMVSSMEDPKYVAEGAAAGVTKFLLKYPPASVLKAVVASGCG